MTGCVLFAWRRMTPPFLIGGAEVSQRLLAEEFARAGWQVIYVGAHEPPWQAAGDLEAMIARLEGGCDYELDKGADVLRYVWQGVHCFAASQAVISGLFQELLTRYSPDLVITSQEGSADLAEAARRRTKVIGWLHSVSATGTAVLHGRPNYVLATSRFVLNHVRNQPNAVLFYPPFSPSRANRSRRDDDLLMVNPVPAKGGKLVRELAARLPERRFTLVEGWWDTRAEYDLPNVTYVSRTEAMDDLYASHRLLLVPSTVPDAFPRVIIEAGLAGLGAVGADVGGIPEAIARAGVVLPPNDADAWAEAIRGLTADRLGRLGAAARIRALPLTRPCLPELTAAGILQS